MQKAILCVDDEAIILMSMEMKLGAHFAGRAEIYSALSAEEGLTIIKDIYSRGIQLVVVISDYLMPGMRGDEFLIKVANDYPEIKAIMVTGMAEKKVIENLKSSRDMKAIFYKPWIEDDLFNAIEECMDSL